MERALRRNASVFFDPEYVHNKSSSFKRDQYGLKMATIIEPTGGQTEVAFTAEKTNRTGWYNLCCQRSKK